MKARHDPSYLAYRMAHPAHETCDAEALQPVCHGNPKRAPAFVWAMVLVPLVGTVGLAFLSMIWSS